MVCKYYSLIQQSYDEKYLLAMPQSKSSNIL